MNCRAMYGQPIAALIYLDQPRKQDKYIQGLG